MRRPSSREALALGAPGAGRAHRHAVEDARVGPAQPDGPVAAVARGAEDRVDLREPLEGVTEQGTGDLRGVHAEEDERLADVTRRVGEALGEPVAALLDDLEAGRKPGAGLAVEDEHAAPRGRPRDGVERVGEGGLGELRRLFGRERRAQARLDASGQRLLGHDDECGGHGRGR